MDGAQFTITSATGNISGGYRDVTAEALVAGADGNLETGAKLSLVSPIAGIDTDGEVRTPGLEGGTDIEDVEDYRARILNGLRVPPAGGGPLDYVTWATEVAGVTRAWEFGNRAGIGTVSLAFVRDDDVSIIPSAGEVTTVQEYLDSKKPLDCRAVYVVAPIAKPVTMEIAISPNNSAVRSAVRAEIADLFRTGVDLETTLAQSKISEAISTAAGEEEHEITTISSLVPGTWELLVIDDPDIDITFTSL